MQSNNVSKYSAVICHQYNLPLNNSSIDNMLYRYSVMIIVCKLYVNQGNFTLFKGAIKLFLILNN